MKRVNLSSYQVLALLVTYLNSFSERNMLFIVMEYGSKSLFDVLQKNFKGINLLYVKKISWQLLIFLKRLEDIGIMHTDLKVISLPAWKYNDRRH
jgi:serine/threonine protein kinase